MSIQRVNYQGRDYVLADGQWLDAQTYISASAAIANHLNQLHQSHAKAVAKKPLTSGHKKTSGLRQKLQPFFFRVVQELYDRSGDFVPRREIVQGLINHPKSYQLLQQAYEASSQVHTFEWYVGNQIDWFSANLTEGILPEGEKLERRKINNCWAYKPF